MCARVTWYHGIADCHGGRVITSIASDVIVHEREGSVGMTTSKRTRMAVDMPPELLRRVKAAAVARELTISEYVASALDGVTPPIGARGTGIITEGAVRKLDELRTKVFGDRVLAEDSTDIIREAREERSRQAESW